MIKYHPFFLNGLELDAFFQKYRIALEVQGTQYQLHSTSWYKDVKKLEDIVNRDRQKRCICLENGIFLLEVWYDEKPEIVIPERIRKLRPISRIYCATNMILLVGSPERKYYLLIFFDPHILYYIWEGQNGMSYRVKNDTFAAGKFV